MNPWQMINLAEYHRRDLQDELEQIRLGQLALAPAAYRPGWFARSMYRLANWMIGTGKQLRRRYEVPMHDCSRQPTGSLAR
jgi:hypothetical protein